MYSTLPRREKNAKKVKRFFCAPVDRQLKDDGQRTDGVKLQTARTDRLPWFSYHGADAVPIEGTVL